MCRNSVFIVPLDCGIVNSHFIVPWGVTAMPRPSYAPAVSVSLPSLIVSRAYWTMQSNAPSTMLTAQCLSKYTSACKHFLASSTLANFASSAFYLFFHRRDLVICSVQLSSQSDTALLNLHPTVPPYHRHYLRCELRLETWPSFSWSLLRFVGSDDHRTISVIVDLVCDQ